MTFSLPKRLAAERLGTGLLAASVVGSGVVGERLTGGRAARFSFAAAGLAPLRASFAASDVRDRPRATEQA